MVTRYTVNWVIQFTAFILLCCISLWIHRLLPFSLAFVNTLEHFTSNFSTWHKHWTFLMQKHRCEISFNSTTCWKSKQVTIHLWKILNVFPIKNTFFSLFNQTSDIYSRLIFFSISCSTVHLACAVFQVDLVQTIVIL